jgi:hypothetical protein
MGNTVQHCSSHLLITKDVNPLSKIKIGSDGQTGSLIELADQVKQ